jgi:hypothetical protein
VAHPAVMSATLQRRYKPWGGRCRRPCRDQHGAPPRGEERRRRPLIGRGCARPQFIAGILLVVGEVVHGIKKHGWRRRSDRPSSGRPASNATITGRIDLERAPRRTRHRCYRDLGKSAGSLEEGRGVAIVEEDSSSPKDGLKKSPFLDEGEEKSPGSDFFP